MFGLFLSHTTHSSNPVIIFKKYSYSNHFLPYTLPPLDLSHHLSQSMVITYLLIPWVLKGPVYNLVSTQQWHYQFKSILLTQITYLLCEKPFNVFLSL